MIFKRGNIWWMEVGGVRESTKMKDEAAARRIYAARKVELMVGTTPAGEVRTLNDAMDRYLLERKDKRSARDDLLRGEWWKQQLGRTPLKLVTSSKLRDAIEAKRQADGISNATANRYLALVRTVLRCCEIDWGWVDSAPKLRTYTEDNHRESYLTKDQIATLMDALPDHLKDMVAFSLTTGLRQANVTNLKWEWVNLQQQLLSVPSSSYKGKRTHTIPLSPTAVDILRRQSGKHGEFVFVYRGERIRHVNNHGWQTALKKAGLQGFRWHDLRHTFASHHAMGGTPLQVLQELGGWKSAAVMQRYAHLSRDHLRMYGSNAPV
jgi:integrase